MPGVEGEWGRDALSSSFILQNRKTRQEMSKMFKAYASISDLNTKPASALKLQEEAWPSRAMIRPAP